MEYHLIVIIISILLSAFFSGMEIAFVSANKFQIELHKKEKGIISSLLKRLTANSNKYITTMLVGNNIVLVIYSLFMGKILTDSLLVLQLNEFSELLIQTLISTIIILIFAEFLPKAIFRIYANEMLLALSPIAFFFYIIFYFISNFLLKYFFKSISLIEKTGFSKAELGHYITTQLENAKDFEKVDSEIQIFQNALEFDTVKAREIMIPRTEIVAVEINENIENLRDLFIKTGYSKILIYQNNLDNILGYVLAFELFKKPSEISKIVLPIEFVPESMLINNVLNLLTKRKKSIAIVLDEFGGTSGILTVEDIVEELFGEIIDEHDTVELLEKQLNDIEFELSARLEVDYLNETYDLGLVENEAYETLGGYIVYHNEDIPIEGEEIEIGNLYFKMIKVDTSKIMEVYVKIMEVKD